MPSLHPIIKDTCDPCGCAEGWGQSGGGDDRSGDDAEWETVGSVLVSSGSPNWDFGARGAGIWKTTAQPVTNRTTGFDGATDSSHLKWNSGGVTMDNYRQRDKSYDQQYDKSSYASTTPFRIDWLQSNGHYPFGRADKVETWGCGHDNTGFYRPYGETVQQGDHGGSGHAVRAHPYFSHNANNHILQGAIFVWMSDVTMHALPSDMPPPNFSHSSGMPYGLESLGRNFLTHTAGGTIAGSISDVDSSIASEQWTVRLHKLSPVPNQLWLINAYTKPVAKVRITRWTGNVSYDTNATNWVFPLWSYDAVLDRSAPAQMDYTCSYHLFGAELNMPLTWQPEKFYAILPRQDPLLGDPFKTFYGPIIGGLSSYTRAFWNQESSPLTKKTVRVEHPVSTTGAVRNGIWQAWSFRPIFEDGTEGEEVSQWRGGYSVRWKGGPRRKRGVSYATFYSWDTPDNNARLENFPLKTSQQDYYHFGASHSIPRPTAGVHDTTISGQPKCLHLGVSFDPSSSYNIVPMSWKVTKDVWVLAKAGYMLTKDSYDVREAYYTVKSGADIFHLKQDAWYRVSPIPAGWSATDNGGTLYASGSFIKMSSVVTHNIVSQLGAAAADYYSAGAFISKIDPVGNGNIQASDIEDHAADTFTLIDLSAVGASIVPANFFYVAGSFTTRNQNTVSNTSTSIGDVVAVDPITSSEDTAAFFVAAGGRVNASPSASASLLGPLVDSGAATMRDVSF